MGVHKGGGMSIYPLGSYYVTITWKQIFKDSV